MVPDDAKPKPATPAGNMNDWAQTLRRRLPDVAARLDERRTAGFARVKELGLPHGLSVSSRLHAFLNDPQPVLGNVGSDLVWVVLVSDDPDLPRVSRSGLPADSAAAYCLEAIRPENRHSYEVIVHQYFVNRYGGNIVINPDQQVYVEFSAGKQTPIARGTGVVGFTARSDPFTGTMRYSFPDMALRADVYRAVQAIPHGGAGRGTRYLPGYYEFALVEKHAGGPLSPVFLDYNPSKAFSLPVEDLRVLSDGPGLA